MEVVVRYHGIVGSRGKDRHEEQHQRLRRNPHLVSSSLAVLGGCGFPQMWTKTRPLFSQTVLTGGAFDHSAAPE